MTKEYIEHIPHKNPMTTVYMVYRIGGLGEINIKYPVGIFDTIADAIEARNKESNDTAIYKVTMNFEHLK